MLPSVGIIVHRKEKVQSGSKKRLAATSKVGMVKMPIPSIPPPAGARTIFSPSCFKGRWSCT